MVIFLPLTQTNNDQNLPASVENLELEKLATHPVDSCGPNTRKSWLSDLTFLAHHKLHSRHQQFCQSWTRVRGRSHKQHVDILGVGPHVVG